MILAISYEIFSIIVELNYGIGVTVAFIAEEMVEESLP